MDKKRVIYLVLNILSGLVSVLASATLVARFGFPLSPSQSALIEQIDLLVLLFFLVQFPVRALMSSQPVQYLRSHWFQALVMGILLMHFVYILSFLGAGGLDGYFALSELTSLTNITVVFTQALVALSLLSGALHLNRRIAALKFHPAQTTFFTFLAVIMTGAMCLMLPLCREPGKSLSFVDAVFTATSATCVTGLAVVDTGSFFTWRGEMVIISLIQIGGLGLMTFSSFLAMFFAGGVGIRERVLLMDMLSLNTMQQINLTLRRMIGLTFTIELIGCICLFFLWQDRPWPTDQRLYYAMFHSISAFCNAGFALFPDSLMSEGNPLVLLTISGLIIFGGLGFSTISEVIRLRRRTPADRLSLQSKLVLTTTALLLVGGTAVLLLIQPLEGSWGHRVLQHFFSAVTARTAGFNAVDYASFNMAATWIVITLMFIGASPGSTGGGLKTSTLAVLFLRMWATLRGRNRVTVAHRNVPGIVANRALVIFAFSMTLLVTAMFLLLLVEKHAMVDLLFELVSAFSTTGLSRGITAGLTDTGKIILSIAMFAGRLGPLTLAFAITAPKDSYPIEFPDETITVG